MTKNEKLDYIIRELKNLQKMFPQYSLIDIEDYLFNLIDIKEEYIKEAFNKIRTHKKNHNFPTIFELRRLALENEGLLVRHFLLKLAKDLKNKDIDFKNEKLSKFIAKQGGWENYKFKILELEEDEFINDYCAFKNV